jgi:hypothetical protein
MFGSWISTLNRICCPAEKKFLLILVTHRSDENKGVSSKSPFFPSYGHLYSNLWAFPVAFVKPLIGHLLPSAPHQQGPNQ